MAIAAAGLGSISEQQEWTVGRWRATCALLPAHEARQDMRASHRALMPYLWRFANEGYLRIWEGWRAVADQWRLSGTQTERSYPAGVVKSPKGLGQWFRSIFGGMVREG